MKRLFGGISVVAIMLVCLTGCGKSSGADLKCTGKMDGNDATVKATLSSDKVTKVVIESKTVAESEEEAKQGVAILNGFGSLNSDSGITMTAEANGKNVTMTMTLDVTKMSSEDLENNLNTTDLTKDGFVKAMEEQGLTCK